METRACSSKDERDMAVKEMMDLLESIGSYAMYRKTQRKECLSLVRRLNLMVPLLEEIREADCWLSDDMATSCLVSLKTALLGAKKLLYKCCSGSKIYLALESEAVMASFQALYDNLNEALDGLPYDDLGISHEVKEQVELMRMQLKRAKKRADTQDIELAMDMMVVFSEAEDRNTDSAVLERLANKLELHTIADLKQETAAVRKLVKDRSVQKSDSIRQVMDLLRKLKQVEGIDERIELEGSISFKVLQRCQSSLIPHEFLCPITMEIMVDPVIVETGQTYERESIKKWLDSNHRTCPKSGQTLEHLSLSPNIALRNLIQQWCEKNNFELPRKDTCQSRETSSIELIEEITALIEALSCIDRLDGVREAVAKIRMLSKENPDNRVLIANNGGILPLVYLLSYPDTEIQEQAVTALLNLSIDASNKTVIAREGAIPGIIAVLQNGTEEARENSAAALFSLSMLDENKALIGALHGIPHLVELLRNGRTRGRKDAATALFNLCMNKANKSRAIKAGVVEALLNLLEDKSVGMVDEGLAILSLLASHPEGRKEIGRTCLVETVVEIIKNGTAKNKECATSVLLELGQKDSSVVIAALQRGVYEDLVEVARSGTNRAQRKANALLQNIEQLPTHSLKLCF